MDDALGDALVIEVRDLFAQDEIFEQRRAARAGLQRVLVVGDRDALVGRQHRVLLVGGLVGLAAVPDVGDIAGFACALGHVWSSDGNCRREEPSGRARSTRPTFHTCNAPSVGARSQKTERT